MSASPTQAGMTMSTRLHNAQIEQNVLLPITPATIQRVREGVAAASDRTVCQCIQNALDNNERKNEK
jgi:hypothetical protein